MCDIDKYYISLKYLEKIYLNRCEKHNQEVIFFSLKETDDIKKQLICAQCTKEKQRITNSISWTDVKSMVEAQRQQRLIKLSQSLKPILDMIEQIQTHTDQTKSDKQHKGIGVDFELEIGS